MKSLARTDGSKLVYTAAGDEDGSDTENECLMSDLDTNGIGLACEYDTNPKTGSVSVVSDITFAQNESTEILCTRNLNCCVNNQNSKSGNTDYTSRHGDDDELIEDRYRYSTRLIARNSIFEQLETNTYPVERVPDTLYGVQNALWMIVGLALIKIPVVRMLNNQFPIDLSLLQWCFTGFGKTMLVYALMTIGSLATFFLQRLAVLQWLSPASFELLYRLTLYVHLVWTNRTIVGSELSPIPSFFLCTQAVVTFMKMHSYYSEVRMNLNSIPNLNWSTSLYSNKVPADSCHIAVDSRRAAYAEALKYVGYRDFFYFWVAPTLVYRPEGYLRTQRIRILFLLRKIGAGVGLISVIYILATEHFLPVIFKANETRLAEIVAVLVLPCTLIFFALFFLVFESMLNIAGELTFYADRHFYDDWWNATSMSEFSRKWNRPVHEWLRQYVYTEARRQHFSKSKAQASTFFFSAIFHELILAVTFRRPRIFLLGLMMLQMPLIELFRGTFQNQHKRRLANICFWFGMFVGPALLSMLYAREWFLENDFSQLLTRVQP